MEDEVEAPVGESREVPHVALDGLQVERLALGDEPVPRQLRRRVVQHGHVGARRREDGALLPAARGEAEDVGAVQVREPRPRHRPVVRQQDLPAASAGPPR